MLNFVLLAQKKTARMFTKIRQIEGVTDNFIVDNHDIYVFHSNGHLSKYNVHRDEKVWGLSTGENIVNSGLLTQSLFCSAAGETKTINLRSGEIENQHPLKILFASNSEKIILAEKKENGQKKILILNEELICTAEKDIKMGKNFLINKELLVSTQYLNDQIIQAFTPGNLSEWWSTNIASYAKFKDIRKESQEGLITHILGLYNQTLWIGLSSGKLIGLDYTDGTKKFSIGFEESVLPKTLANQVTNQDYIPFGELMQLDSRNGEIIGLRDGYFMKADLGMPSPKREYISVTESMAAHEISSSFRSYSFPFDENFIYFCDDRRGKIGLFDREKEETIWSTALNIPDDGIAKLTEMKVSNNVWCILDRNGVLHIFERT
jgi:hypothetical protein